ncbi:MAG: DUF4159 domain-containing protein [Acidocella sp.]|nr:DUF4159 domain-containing protein [Acidocella sp.]
MIFTAPLALAALLVLIPLYFILRLTPPAPRRQIFPPLALLQNLSPASPAAHRLPLWLLLLRLAATAILVVGFAGPILHPPPALPGRGPILLVIDNGWEAAADWPDRMAAAQSLVTAAAIQHRRIAILATANTSPDNPPFIIGPASAAIAAHTLLALQPEPWPTNPRGALAALANAYEATRIYIADPLQNGRETPAFLAALHPTRILSPATAPPRLAPVAVTASGGLALRTLSNQAGAGWRASAANGATLARGTFDKSGKATLALPPQLMRQITRITLDGPPSAGGIILLDHTNLPHLLGLDSAASAADTPFLGALYFLRRALPLGTTIISGTLDSLIAQSPDLICLADTPLTPPELTAARGYIASGGIILRFAGPLTADQPDALNADPLVRGDRHLGGSLTWASPASLAPFPPSSPFAGLPADPNITITRQILADPTRLDPATIWATLSDGTPLILGSRQGQGLVINILTAANTSWSSLPLSGLFPQLLVRILGLSHGIPSSLPTTLPLQNMLTAFGTLTAPSQPAQLNTSKLADTLISPAQPPGIYGTQGDEIALNLVGHIPPPHAATYLNATSLIGGPPPNQFGTTLIAIALSLLALDLALSLRLRGIRLLRQPAGLLLMVALSLPLIARAQPQPSALHPTLGYIATGDPTTDRIAADGMAYLSATIASHTSITLGPPIALNPATDDLAFYPLIYWLLPPDLAPLPAAACTALNQYMQNGGLLVIDQQGGGPDAPGSGAGLLPGAALALQNATACLAIPPLEPLAPTNVLAHCFYIVPGFPGRFTGAPILIAITPARDADHVTPIILSQNDWAGAWARDADGIPEQTPLPGGDAQRVIADRFGINLVVYALTGSYKADQVFAPGVLDRLGQ